MPKLLRPFAVLLLAATALYAAPPKAGFVPTCFNLPSCQFPDITWQFSHQCRCPQANVLPNCPANRIMYVYKSPRGTQCLYASAILP